MTEVIQRWLTLDRRERRVVISATMALAVVSVTLRLAGLRRLLRTLSATTRHHHGAPRVDRIVTLVESTAHVLPWHTTCLHRALVSAWLMRRYGFDGALVIGARAPDGTFSAHAWVEHAGRRLSRAAAPDVPPFHAWPIETSSHSP